MEFKIGDSVRVLPGVKDQDVSELFEKYEAHHIREEEQRQEGFRFIFMGPEDCR